MQDWLPAFLSGPQTGLLLSLPLVAALVGWFTNWIAIEMTFRPLRYMGWRFLHLGWQGIVPAKAGKMAGLVVDHALTRLTSLSELFRELQPELLAAHISDHLNRDMVSHIDDVMYRHHPVFWESLPWLVKQRIHARIRRQVPVVVDGIVDELAENIEDLIDLRSMVVRQLSANPALVVRAFREVGASELHFVVRSGLWFGLLFGCVQLAVWLIWPEPWLIPIAGLLVGWVTNWLALNLVFRPLEPVRIGPFRIQGLFLQHKAQVAQRFAALVADEVLTLDNLLQEIMQGPQADRSRAIIRRHLTPVLDNNLVQAVVQFAIGAEGQAQLRQQVLGHVMSLSLHSLAEPRFHHERSRMIENLLYRRMLAMSNADFQNVLRPAFKEDEWILIALGAALGGVAGVLQMLLA